MKTIATAAVLMMLTAPTWADEAATKQANEPANTDEPIVLSEAEMDGVTAGGWVGSGWDLFVGEVTVDTRTSANGTVTSYTYDRQGRIAL